jgi:hypothetical protein
MHVPHCTPSRSLAHFHALSHTSTFLAQLGTTQLGTTQLGTAHTQLGTAQLGTAQLGTAQLGTAQLGTAWHSLAQLNTEQNNPYAPQQHISAAEQHTQKHTHAQHSCTAAQQNSTRARTHTHTHTHTHTSTHKHTQAHTQTTHTHSHRGTFSHLFVTFWEESVQV